MKKMLHILIAVLFMLVVAPSTAKAEVYYFDNTKTGWDHVSVWAWQDGTNQTWLLDNGIYSWPGAEILKDDASGYYIWHANGEMPADGAIMFNNATEISEPTEMTCVTLAYGAYGNSGKVCVPTVKNTAKDEAADSGRKAGTWYGEWRELEDRKTADWFEVSLNQYSFSYTGKYIKPVVTVKTFVGGKMVTLTNWKDYKVKYSNFKNPGTATITVTGRGKYSGSTTINFKIRPIDISNFKVTLNQRSFAYTGKVIKPKVTVKGRYKGKDLELTNWKDYKITYKNCKNAGLATMEIKGRGIYGGTKIVKFNIKHVELDDLNISLNQYTFKKTGEYIKPIVNISGKVAGKYQVLTNWKDYKLMYKNNKNSGEATITIVGRGNFTGVRQIKFLIR